MVIICFHGCIYVSLKTLKAIKIFVLQAKIFQKIPPTLEHIMTLIFEILYLWSAFPHCTQESLEKMLAGNEGGFAI